MSDASLSPEALERKLEAMKQKAEKEKKEKPKEKPVEAPEKTLDEINIERSRMLEEAAYRDLAEARNLFDVDEILIDALKPRKLLLPELGDDSFHVYWCPLNSVDRVEIARIEDKNIDVRANLINRKAVYLMLSKADERCTEEIVQRMPAHWIDVIMTRVAAEQRSFLSPLVRSVLDGLRPTSRLRRNR